MTLQTLQLGLQWFPENGGGLDRVYYELFHALPKAGIGFHGLVAGSHAVETATHGAVRAFAPPDANLLKRLISVRGGFNKFVNEYRPDLIVSHFALYSASLVDKLTAQPLVIHFHGPWASESAIERSAGFRNGVKKWVENSVYSRASRAIVLSSAFAKLLADHYHVPPERISVIPGGVNIAQFAIQATANTARDALGWPQNRPIILTVRRLVPRMGLENLITAMLTIRKKIPDILLLIAGKGMLATQLAAQISTFGLENNVKLLGFLANADLPLAYRAADLSVVPTTALEGFGLIAAESLAAGTPCLVTPVGGLPEVVARLSPNLVMPSPASADMADAITQALLGNLSLPDAAACRIYAEQNFAWNIIAEAVAGVYRQAVASP